MSIGLGAHYFADQAIAILDHDMAKVAQLGFLPMSLLIRPRLRAGLGFVRFVAPLLAVELAAILGTFPILSLEAFLSSPGFDQRSIHRKVFVGHEAGC